MPIEQAATKLSEIVKMLAPGDEIVLTEDGQPVAKIVPSQPADVHRRPAACKGMLTIVAEDEEHLKDFSDYMS
jgi:antitoxin (DNA-binding transcriptional repressor) of toxin-antitoxin stability system